MRAIGAEQPAGYTLGDASADSKGHAETDVADGFTLLKSKKYFLPFFNALSKQR